MPYAEVGLGSCVMSESHERKVRLLVVSLDTGTVRLLGHIPTSITESANGATAGCELFLLTLTLATAKKGQAR